MKKRIKEIHLQNFKVFKKAEIINLDAKNALIFGNNGSGKSSLYWALYTFLQSSTKQESQVQKYFKKGGKESLLNLFEDDSVPAYIKLYTIDENQKEDGYLVSENTVNTNCAEIKESNQASDFFNYRMLLRFFHFRHSEPINLFPIFITEFFPYWSDGKYGTYDSWFAEIKNELPVVTVNGQKRHAGKSYKVFKEYQKKIDTFNSELNRKITAITEKATDFYVDHFFKEDKLIILLSFDQQVVFDSERWCINEPSISLKVQYRGKEIERPQSFLNESRLTAIALSIKFATLQNRLYDAELKFLVFDDLLLSIDMSNRMSIIKIILAVFSEYQIIILTHDKGFYEIIKKNLFSEEDDWKCFEFYQASNLTEFNNPMIIDDDDYLAKAENNLEANKLEESALYLRKKVEELINIYYDPSLDNLIKFYTLDTLCNSLKKSALKSEHFNNIISPFINLLENNAFDLNYLSKLKKDKFAYDRDLPDDLNSENIKFRGLINAIVHYIENKDDREKELNQLIQDAKNVDELRMRILNNGAHYNQVPMYKKEIEDAISEIKKFQTDILKLKKKRT